MRLLLVVLIASAMLAAGAPATLVDRGIAVLSGDGLRLSAPAGTIWRGGGVVNVVDAGTRVWQPWCRINWSFDPIGLFRGRASWQIMINGAGESALSFGLSGWEASRLRISGPAKYFLQRIPGTFGGFNWDGDITLDIGSVGCSWRGQCDGSARVDWLAAGSSFLPGQVFGDYRAVVTASHSLVTFDWSSSESSKVHTKGKGAIFPSGAFKLAGEVRGDPGLLSRLPAVAGPWVKPTAAGDTWNVIYP